MFAERLRDPKRYHGGNRTIPLQYNWVSSCCHPRHETNNKGPTWSLNWPKNPYPETMETQKTLGLWHPESGLKTSGNWTSPTHIPKGFLAYQILRAWMKTALVFPKAGYESLISFRVVNHRPVAKRTKKGRYSLPYCRADEGEPCAGNSPPPRGREAPNHRIYATAKKHLV